MARETLTDRRLKSLKPAPKGTDRYEIADAIVPGLRVRVTEAGKKTFVLLARYPDPSSPNGYSKNMTRREVGVYTGDKLHGEELGQLDSARKTAREWIQLIASGIDPKKHIEEKRAQEQVRQSNTFGDVVATYLKTMVIGRDPEKPIMRSADDVKRALEVEFLNDKWETGEKGKSQKGKGKLRRGLRDRALSGVTKADILKVIDDAMARGADTTAHNCLAYVRAFFNWAIESGRYDIDSSPCDRIKPKSVIGKKVKRKRVLNDGEIAAYWEAATVLGYPMGDVYKLLLLSGLRRAEVADAPWVEFDLKQKMWTIPKERMKKENDHHAPLAPAFTKILDGLPRHNEGDFVFSTTGGIKAVNGFSKAKTALDTEMLAVLKRKAVEEGRNPDTVTLQPFVIHDIRRTVRTRLSSLGVSKVVAELVIAHTQKELDAVYDQWAFIDERRHALELWADKVRSIVEPHPDNVISLTSRTAS